MMRLLGVGYRFTMEHVAPVFRWTIGAAVFLGGMAALGESIASHRSTERILEWSLGASLLMIVGLFVHVHELGKQHATSLEEISSRSDWAVAVVQVGESPAPINVSEESIEDWLAIESECLLGPLLEHETSKRVRKPQVAGVQSEFGILESAQVQNLLSGVLSPFAGLAQPENRTAGEFRNEVDVYIEGCRPNAVAAAIARLVEGKRSRLQLCLRNLTNSNLAGVKLELEIDAPARFFVGAPIEDVQLPSRPRRWGTRTRLPFSALGISGITSLGFRKADLPQAQVTENGRLSRVVFFPVHLRPEDEIHLDPISVVVTTEQVVSGQARARWRLTTTSEDGSRGGELEIAFGQSASIASLLEKMDGE